MQTAISKAEQYRIDRIQSVVAKMQQSVEKNHGINLLLDTLMVELNLRTDSALAREIGKPASMVSRLRTGGITLGPAAILAIHENTGMPVDRIRQLASS